MSRPAFSSRPVKSTDAPSAMNNRTVAFPMPLVPPTTSATLLLSLVLNRFTRSRINSAHIA